MLMWLSSYCVLILGIFFHYHGICKCDRIQCENSWPHKISLQEFQNAIIYRKTMKSGLAEHV